MECIEATTVTLFVDKRLPPERMSAVEGHVDGCSGCRRLLSELARDRTNEATAEPGDRIDRYVLLRVVGSGGMGTVYAAYDPTLDRKVAIKLLRTLDHDGGTRLIGEARAMARVTSANVVAVYDAGAVGEEVFVSMELVGGSTMRSWMRSPHRWPEIVRVFASAGRGLADAHDGGLVHRDFKPDNVLIDGDRVCVADFGLAAHASGSPGDGTIAGTPAYMAPEQHAGGTVDARSDQFSFCVALYEALHGTRPFAGATLDELVAAVRSGKIRAGTARVPAWLQAIVVRGLAVDPAKRFPSMHGLLAEVARRRRRPRVVATAVVGIAIAAIGTTLGARYFAPGADPCEAAGIQAPAFDAAAIRKGFGTATDTADRVIARLEAWRTEAGALRASTCKASRVDGVESEQLADLRSECVDDSARRVSALATALASPTPSLVDDAVPAVERAIDLGRCRSRRALLEPMRLPDDPTKRVAYQQLRGQLAIAKATSDAGRYGDASKAATDVATAAAKAEFRPLEAEAWATVAKAESDSNQPLAARDVLQRALVAAEAAGDERSRITIDLQLAAVDGTLDRDDDAGRLVAQAKAIAARLGDDSLRAQLLSAEGAVANRGHDNDKALASFQAALAAHGDGEDLGTADLLQSIGGSLAILARYAESEKVLRRALAIREKVAGPNSAILIDVLSLLGGQMFMAGNATESVKLLERALAIAESAPGRGHAHVPTTVMTLAMILNNLDRTPEALAMIDRARAPVASAYGETSDEYAGILETRARALKELGRLDEANTDAVAAVAIARAPGHAARGESSAKADNDLAVALETLGIVQEARKAYPDEIASYTEALAIRTRHGQNTFDDESGLGGAYIVSGKYVESIPHMERAIALRSTGAQANSDTVELADVKANLAQVLIELHRDRPHTLALLHEARAVYVASDHAAEQLKQVTELLAKIGAK